MNDRELLELVAKVTSLPIKINIDSDRYADRQVGGNHGYWNRLSVDSDTEIKKDMK